MKIFIESIIMAFDAVRANKLRSGLTLLSIAIGIFAIIGAGVIISLYKNRQIKIYIAIFINKPIAIVI